MRKSRIILFILHLICYVYFTGNVSGKSTGLKTIEFLGGWQNPDGSYITAIVIDLEDNWKTYWRQSGEFGVDPDFSLSNSTNLKSFKFIWPAPILFGEGEFWSIGYYDKLILPLKIFPIHKKKPVNIDIEAQIGICSTMCIPITFHLKSSVSPQNIKRNPEIIAALVNTPTPQKNTGFVQISCDFERVLEVTSINLEFTLPNSQSPRIIVIDYKGSDHQTSFIDVLEIEKKLGKFGAAGKLKKTEDTIINMLYIDATQAIELEPCRHKF